ncbi:MAG TPA: ankyrin repeat domain-containing protein [Chitinophagaceae bacterium]|nr:ankyrin repeat domain-containing protein [Chitinophagaceae bacterium]
MNRPSAPLLLVLLFYALCAKAQDTTADTSNNALFHIIRSGDNSALRAMLAAGADANAQQKGYSALMAASLSGTRETMQTLIEKGANVNYANADGISALWLAVPDYEKVSLLISKGANVQQRSRDKNTVLVKLASIPGSAALMQLLIEHGCDPRNSGPVNDIMYNAASSCDTAIVGMLIRAGVSVTDSAVGGDYPLSSALNYRCFNTLKMLVDAGANVNVSPKHSFLPLFSGMTPLMWAAVGNDKPSFYYLLSHGADPKATSPGGYTTLMFLAMAEDDDPEMTMALINKGVSPAHKAFDETDALQHALLRGNTRSVAILSKYMSNK